MGVGTITGCHSIGRSEVLRMLSSLAICSSLVWTTNYTSDVYSQTHAYINTYYINRSYSYVYCIICIYTYV